MEDAPAVIVKQTSFCECENCCNPFAKEVQKPVEESDSEEEMEEEEEESGASGDEEVDEVYWSRVSESLLLVIVCLSVCPFVRWGLFLLHLHVVGPGSGLWYLTYTKICFTISLTTKRADESYSEEEMEEEEEESGASRDEEVGVVYWSHTSESLLLVIVCLSICPFVRWGLFLLHLHVVGPGTGLWYLTYAKICFIISLTTKRADEICLALGGVEISGYISIFFLLYVHAKLLAHISTSF